MLVLELMIIAQLAVPTQCMDLAKREGFPTDYLDERQLADARRRMHQLKKSDPVVKQCQDAIDTIRRIQKESTL